MNQIDRYGVIELDDVLYKLNTELEEWMQTFLNQTMNKNQLRNQYYMIIFVSILTFRLLNGFLVTGVKSWYIYVFLSFLLVLVVGEILMNLEEYKFRI
jgi:hypothetical protein